MTLGEKGVSFKHVYASRPSFGADARRIIVLVNG